MQMSKLAARLETDNLYNTVERTKIVKNPPLFVQFSQGVYTAKKNKLWQDIER